MEKSPWLKGKEKKIVPAPESVPVPVLAPVPVPVPVLAPVPVPESLSESLSESEDFLTQISDNVESVIKQLTNVVCMDCMTQGWHCCNNVCRVIDVIND